MYRAKLQSCFRIIHLVRFQNFSKNISYLFYFHKPDKGIGIFIEKQIFLTLWYMVPTSPGKSWNLKRVLESPENKLIHHFRPFTHTAFAESKLKIKKSVERKEGSNWLTSITNSCGTFLVHARLSLVREYVVKELM